ncbi:MAG TPA: hypothetical protein VHY32_00255 [Caulobacteraceae bacterium]|nr:hypothetical protein [Caulobacteraceae bacterium]
MKTYFLYLRDDRYTVPTLDMINARDDDRAITAAVGRLAYSPHYQSVEVWEDDRLVARLDRSDIDPETT